MNLHSARAGGGATSAPRYHPQYRQHRRKTLGGLRCGDAEKANVQRSTFAIPHPASRIIPGHMTADAGIGGAGF